MNPIYSLFFRPDAVSDRSTSAMRSESPHRSSLGRRQEFLQVSRGQLTFDAEGQERGPFFSRVISKPPGTASGVTIGRGYDMGQRSQDEVLRDLLQAGVPLSDAEQLSFGAGLRGTEAGEFVANNRATMPLLGLREQQTLFEDVVYPQYEAEVRRISENPDVVSRYGVTDWANLDQRIKDVLIDLRFRGDYTAETRARLQEYVVNNDVDGFTDAIVDESYWRMQHGVPEDRFRRRVQAMTQ